MTLAEIRAKLQATESRGQGSKQSGGDNAIYPHWNIAEGSTARVRFLPDANTNNSFFWAERAMINLEFNGVKGQADSKKVTVKVPCMEMYGEQCPVLAEVRPWFKDTSLEELGRKYWKKRSYIFQGFVRENALTDDASPENPIRRFTISPQIFNIIKAALMDPEMEELPTDFQRGLDFQIVKTSKGGYADYSTSKWSRKESALTADEQAAVDQFGLFNLSDFLPKKPSETDLKVIVEMFHASVNGEAYDVEKWGAYYKPFGLNTPEGAAKPAAEDDDETATASAPAPAPVAKATPVVEDSTPAPTAPVETAAPVKQNAQDILAMIRNRQKQ